MKKLSLVIMFSLLFLGLLFVLISKKNTTKIIKLKKIDFFLNGYSGKESPAIVIIPNETITNSNITNINNIEGFETSLEKTKHYPFDSIILLPPGYNFFEAIIHLPKKYFFDRVSNEIAKELSKKGQTPLNPPEAEEGLLYYTNLDILEAPEYKTRKKHCDNILSDWNPNKYLQFKHHIEQKSFKLESGEIYILQGMITKSSRQTYTEPNIDAFFKSIIFDWQLTCHKLLDSPEHSAYRKAFEKKCKNQIPDNKASCEQEFERKNLEKILSINIIISSLDLTEKVEDIRCIHCGYINEQQNKYCLECGKTSLSSNPYDIFIRETLKQKE